MFKYFQDQEQNTTLKDSYPSASKFVKDQQQVQKNQENSQRKSTTKTHVGLPIHSEIRNKQREENFLKYQEKLQQLMDEQLNLKSLDRNPSLPVTGPGQQFQFDSLQQQRQVPNNNHESETALETTSLAHELHQDKINFVIKQVENLLTKKIQEGNFNVNVNQLETAICEVIGPETQQNFYQEESTFQNQQQSVSSPTLINEERINKQKYLTSNQQRSSSRSSRRIFRSNVDQNNEKQPEGGNKSSNQSNRKNGLNNVITPQRLRLNKLSSNELNNSFVNKDQEKEEPFDAQELIQKLTVIQQQRDKEEEMQAEQQRKARIDAQVEGCFDMDYHFQRAVGKMRSTNERKMLNKTKAKVKTFVQREPNLIEKRKKTKIHYQAPDEVIREIFVRVLEKKKPLIDIPIQIESKDHSNQKNLRIVVSQPGVLKYAPQNFEKPQPSMFQLNSNLRFIKEALQKNLFDKIDLLILNKPKNWPSFFQSDFTLLINEKIKTTVIDSQIKKEHWFKKDKLLEARSSSPYTKQSMLKDFKNQFRTNPTISIPTQVYDFNSSMCLHKTNSNEREIDEFLLQDQEPPPGDIHLDNSVRIGKGLSTSRLPRNMPPQSPAVIRKHGGSSDESTLVGQASQQNTLSVPKQPSGSLKVKLIQMNSGVINLNSSIAQINPGGLLHMNSQSSQLSGTRIPIKPKPASSPRRSQVQNHREYVIMSQKELDHEEILLLEQSIHQKNVKKSLIKSLTTQADRQQIKKKGVMLEESSLSDSILYLYWKQRMAKQFFIMSNPDVLDNMDTFNFEDEKVEENFNEFNLDIKPFYQDEKQLQSKMQERYYKDMMAQLYEALEFSDKHLLNLDQIYYFFIRNILDESLSETKDQYNDDFFPKLLHCQRSIFRLISRVYFNQLKYEKLMKYYESLGSLEYKDETLRKEHKAARVFGLNNHGEIDFHNPVKVYLFRHIQPQKNDIIRIVFQPHSHANIFQLIVDLDEDYELSLILDTIIQLSQFKLERSQKFQREYNFLRQKLLRVRKRRGSFMKKREIKKSLEQLQKDSFKLTLQIPSDESFSSESLSDPSVSKLDQSINALENNDFLPLQRKNALRKSLGFRKIHCVKKQHSDILKQSKVYKTKISLTKGFVRILKGKKSTPALKRDPDTQSRSSSNEEEDEGQQQEDDDSIVTSEDAAEEELDEVSLYDPLDRSQKTISERQIIANKQHTIIYRQISSLKKDFIQPLHQKSQRVGIRKELQDIQIGNLDELRHQNNSISIDLKRHDMSKVVPNSEKLRHHLGDKPQPKNNVITEGMLIRKFGYQCVFKVDESKTFLFEIFTPIELKKDREDLEEIKSPDEKPDDTTLTTNSSLQDYVDDKFQEFDIKIQREQLKKFFQNQKVRASKKERRGSYLNRVKASTDECLIDQMRTNKGSSLDQMETQSMSGRNQGVQRQQLNHHKYTSIGTYYKNLTKQKKSLYHEQKTSDLKKAKENELAGEVVSGEEFSEGDADNFYIQMRNNIQIQELLNEVGAQKEQEQKLIRYKSTKVVKKTITNLTEKGAELKNQKSSKSRGSKHNNQNNSYLTSLFSESDYKSYKSEAEIELEKKQQQVHRPSIKSFTSREAKRISTNSKDVSSFAGTPRINILAAFSNTQQQALMSIKKQRLKFNSLRPSPNNIIHMKIYRFFQKGDHQKVKFYPLSFSQKNLYQRDQAQMEKNIIKAVKTQDLKTLTQCLRRFDLNLDNYRDTYGNTLLNIATQLGNKQIVDLMLLHGADPNIQNYNGNVPLHYAIGQGFIKITNMLMSYGADERIVNNLGRTCWEKFKE